MEREVMVKMRWMKVKERVANAYHDYGRLCAAHPRACLSMSLLTMIVLSYPAITRLRMPVSTPIDVFWSEDLHVKENIAPFWIKDNPASYIQQFIISTSVEPWNATNMNPEQAVRGAVAAAFRLRKILLSDPHVEELCLRLTPPRTSEKWPFRSSSNCVVLSPASIWYNEVRKFIEDPNAISTIYHEDCKLNFCMRDLLLGAPISATGIKERYQTNRKRSIEFAVTIFFARYSKSIISNLRSRIQENEYFDVLESPANDGSTFVQVYFHPLKKFSDYLPLISAYLLCMIYLYFSSRKFEMVSSRWGLAFAASFTVAATLLMTTGICAHLDLSTTLWGAELYPYIALILGLENTLCITRSVVYTPPSLDVSSRIAHGLSKEGYKLTKYFVLELIFIICGYLTGVSDIQEFCQFSAICIVVDFYMQLFFYAPCLTFDLQRLGLEEKRRFAEILFYAEIPRLKNYAAVNCPMRKCWPKLFELKKIQKRRLSDSGVEEVFSPVQKKDQRRLSTVITKSREDSELHQSEADSSFRMRVLYFITRTRIVQRTIMIVFAVWSVWLAFFVGSRQVIDDGDNTTITNQSFEHIYQSHRILSAANLEYGQWQRRTYKWWPPVAHEYNISLNSRYVTFLPPILLSARIPSGDVLLYPVNESQNLTTDSSASGPDSDSSEAPILRSRIDWLEMQLKMYLAAFWLLLVTTVVTFFAYACLSDRWRFGGYKLLQDTIQPTVDSITPPVTSTSGKNFVETLPIVFNIHRFPIETVALDEDLTDPKDLRLISCCQEGIVIVWNAQTGDRIMRLNRLRMAPEKGKDMSLPPKVWAISKRQDIAVLGCADGSVEIASLTRNKLIGVYDKSTVGVSHIVCHNDDIAVCRIDGTIDFINIVYEVNPDSQTVIRVREIRIIKSIRGHQKTICRALNWNDFLITSSFDRSIKLWKWENGEMKNMFLAHNSPVISVVVSEETGMMFSCCEEGIVCWWNLETGELIRTIDNNCNWAFHLATTSMYLLGFFGSSQLFLWSLENGQLACRVTDASSDGMNEDFLNTVGSSGVVSFGDQIAATASGHSVTFWDLNHRAIIGKVKVGGRIGSMRKLTNNSVLCGVGNIMYSVTVPLVRIK